MIYPSAVLLQGRDCMVTAQHCEFRSPVSYWCYVALLATFSACHIQETAACRNVVGFTISVASLEVFHRGAFLSVSLGCVKAFDAINSMMI